MTDRHLPRPTNASDLLGVPDASSAPPAPSSTPPAPSTTGPELRIEDLILFDSAGNDPVSIDSIVFTDEGIGVARTSSAPPRVLPWSAVSAHVVERWPGGVVPAWWVTPQPRPSGPAPSRGATVAAPAGGTAPSSPAAPSDSPGKNGEAVGDRSLPHAARGAVIAIQTPFGTYRFLRPGADAVELSNRITDFAVRHQGLSGVPSVTLVARPRRGKDRRQGSRSRPAVSGWPRAKPYLTIALVAFILTAVTLILLQSAGAVHIPYLGGAGSGQVAPVRIG